MTNKKGYRGVIFPETHGFVGAFDIVEVNENNEIVRVISYDN